MAAEASGFTLTEESIENHGSAPQRCRLLELPAEVRELMWIHTVTEWRITRPQERSRTRLLEKTPIRIDKFNQPLPPPITRTCAMTRNETLPLYYQQNVFEAWQPLFWAGDWSQLAFCDFLTAIGPERTGWLREVVLLYKHDSELRFDIESALAYEGFNITAVVRRMRALNKYEMCCEEMGLPKQFQGRRSRTTRVGLRGHQG